MSISWTHKFDSTDDGTVPTGAMLGTMQDDIDTGTSGSVPTPGVTDGLKFPRVKSDHSDYELVAQVPMAAGGTGADLSVGTAGYAVISQGTAGNMKFAPLYHTAQVSFVSDSGAQTAYCVSPVTGVVTAVYQCGSTAARGAVYTAKVGSAGDTIATATVLSTGVAGTVVSLTLGTVAITAGASISVNRGIQGTAGESMVTVVIIKTP